MKEHWDQVLPQVKKRLRQSVAVLLAGVLTVGVLPGEALAALAEKPEQLTFVDGEGNTVSTTEDWESAFPYGTFAFSNFQSVVKEGEETSVIQVYRLGGTKGRAVAYISYTPVLTQMEDGGISYSTAAGSNDIVIEAEDPLPGAENQPIGQPEAPKQPKTPVKVTSTPVEDGASLSIDVTASAYQWYVSYAGDWEAIDGATDREMTVDKENLAERDFRCVYTVGGVQYCSDSYRGVAYVEESAAEEPAETESDEIVALNPEPTYTRITPESAEDPYSGYVFELTFADGEWMKEIRVTAPEDSDPEALKFGTFTIVDHLGASLYDTANTLALQVVDNDAPEESQLGFVVTDVRADKAAGKAEITVQRTGGNQSMITVDYATQDGSAKAGEDYAAASGTLTFYGDMDEQVIEIPLIDDGVVTQEERSFQVVLSNLKGDGEAACTLNNTTAVVALYNSGESDGQNLVTHLYQSEVSDISGTVAQKEDSVVSVGDDTITAVQTENEDDVLTAQIEGSGEGDVSTLSYNYPGRLSFSNGGWSYAENIPSSGWSGGSSYDGGIWTYRSSGAGSATLTFDPRIYKGIYASFGWECALASDWTLTWYGMEYTYPWAKLLTQSGAEFAKADSGVTDNGSYWSPEINWHTSGSMNKSWSIADGVNRLQLGTSRHDSHNSSGDAQANLKSGSLYRRTFDGDFYLQIHTANDSGEGYGNSKTAPDGAASLTESSGVYNSMRPVVTIQSGQGGVYGGHLFVGTTLQVELKNTASYEPAKPDSNLTYAVYLTDKNGKVVASSSNSGTTHYLKLLWDGMTDADLKSNYTINVVMTRKQDLKLDLTPSVPRKTDGSGNLSAEIDTSKIGQAINDFWSSTSAITYGYSEEKYTNGKISYIYHDNGKLTRGNFTQSGAILSKLDLENIQWINFNLPAEDKIVYNGRTYGGNEKIYLSVADLASSSMTFYYYDSAYLSATSVMSANISEMELFLDGNANGKIDGYYDDKTGYFILDASSGDESFGFLDPNTDYNETIFTPVPVEVDGVTKYAQYFVKAYYTMNPRSLVPPEGTDTNNAWAQVLPAFVSSVTDPDSYATLTTEQQSYRYLISGMTKLSQGSDDVRSSDYHTMYGSEATVRSMVDVPLGGDTSPAELNEAGTAYTWTPHYEGNLLYPFDNPEPIFIANSVAGSNIPIAEIKGYENGQVVLEDGGKELLNGYLGSLTANNTIALCVQEQKATTEEIARANGITIGSGDIALQSEGQADTSLNIESTSKTDTKTTPDASYLQENGAAGEADGSVNMDNAGSDYKEFDQDFFVQLPSTDIGVTDFASIVMDGDQVGFSLGLPLGGYSSGDGATSPAKALADSKEDMEKLLAWMKNRNKETAKATDDSYKNVLDKRDDSNSSFKNGKAVTSKGFSAEFSLGIAFLWKFDTVSNEYKFSQFSVSASVELSFKYQARFTPVPLIYMYVSVGFSTELSTGATVERETVEGASLLSQSVSLKKSEYKILSATSYKSSNLTFNGKLLVEAYTDPACTQAMSGFEKGYLESNGKDPVLVVLKKQDGATLDKPVYLKLTALEDTQLDSAVEVVKTQNLSYWSGFTISPEVFVEAGVGVGIEIMKFEVYVKINLGCSMTLGAYDTDSHNYEGFSFDEFEFGLGLGFRVVLLFFSYEMDLISYSITYEKDRDPDEWQHSWSALGGLRGESSELSTMSATDADGNTYAVHISLPGSAADTQELYTANTGSDLETLAFDPTDKEVPFQLSGYGSSGDAFKLADGLISGYDYKVVTVGENNYLLYTVSRTDADNPVDNSMLVLSRIQLTSTGGSEEYGLVNPVNAGSETPYIVVDGDKTGDLEFTGWADGNTLRIAWVSYATAAGDAGTVGEKPAGTAPGGMTESNYEQVFADFKATEPEEVTDPGEEPVEPAEADYYVSAEVYASLTTDLQAKYTVDTASEYYYAKNYSSYEDASQAYKTAQSQYITDKKAYQDYQDYLSAKAAYESEYQTYNAWYLYFKSVHDVNAATQEVANQAAQNTVVKTASFNTAAPAAITDVKSVSGEAGSHVYLPGGSSNGSVIIYAKARHYTDTTDLENQYGAYLDKVYTSDDASKNIKAYRESYQKGLWDAYGSGTDLHAVVGNQDVAASLPAGQILDNMEITEINGVYYVAYTTSEQSYVQGNNYKDVSGENATDQLTTKRLYLQTLTVPENGTPVWGSALLLRTLVDYDQNTGTDGVYEGGKLTAYQDPYFSNLQFLNGKLGGLEGESESFATLSETAPEEFLLFEMDGSTFVIPQDDLVSIAGEHHSGSIIPFFQPAKQAGADGEDVTPSSTGRAEVTIGADGAGNISAVYVGTVKGTTNNALFLTKWDPESQTWGAGTMLAMNYMQVYEDAAANGWSASDTEQAYLGKLDGYTGGGMDQFTFSNLQIALGQTAQTEEEIQTMSASETSSAQVDLRQILAGLGGETDVQTMSEDGAPALTGEQNALLAESGAGKTKDTLLVLTQGTTQYLQEATYTDANGKEQTVVVPIDDDYAQGLYDQHQEGYTKKPGLGVYAISYGVGQRSVGNANVNFSLYDFSAGSELYVKASFQNTGDVALRGSEANPITAQLMLRTKEGTEPTVLAKWEIPQDITAGQTVSLSGNCAALTEDLPEGSIFYLDVAEDDTYITDGAFSGTTLTQDSDTGAWTGGFVVEKKPELGFEHFDITTAGVDEKGDTILNVDFQVGNRGNKTAKDVYVQFSYESSRDENNDPVYSVLDITGNDLKVSKQEKLEPLSENGDTDAKNGILRLENAADGGDMDPNMGRTVTGTLTVPPEVYQGAVNGSLNLQVEIFAGDDVVESRGADGLITASHNEYNTDNNAQVAQIEHTTFFETAAKVTLAMGNTMRLPVSIATSTGKTPVIQVEEVHDTEGAAKNLGVLYYEQTANPSTGNTEGVLVIAPSKEGSGIIHIKDEATNTIQAIAYEVTGAGEGINIFKDNGMFTFYNKNGSKYDEGAQAGTQDWSFNDNISTWGSDSSAPYLSNLSNGKVGARFTFDTVATSIDFHFNGKIKVESTYPGFKAKELTCAGGKQFATVSFGSSEQSHTVTVTVLDSGDTNSTADFDVLVEHFASGQPPVPAVDANHPHIYWSRSFPDTASLKAGESQVELTVYALDDTGIASLTVNGQEIENLTKHSAGYWSAQLTVKENGKLDVAAVDNAGNRTTQAVTVDWFNTTLSGSAISTAPDLTAQFQKNGQTLTDTDYVTGSDTVVAAAQSATEGVTYSAQRITVHETEEGTSELEITKLDPKSGAENLFDAKANGYYLVTATAPDGTWSQTVLEMTQVDTQLPVASLSLSEDGTSLDWSVSKSDPKLSPITGATLNDFDLNVDQSRSAVAGNFSIQYGGTYVLSGVDAAGHTAEQSLSVAGLPIQADGESICTVTDSWNQEKNNGVITINPAGLTGGVYDAKKSSPEANEYCGRYEVLLVSAADVFDAEAVRKELLDAYAEQYFAEHPDAERDDPAAVMPEEELNAALAQRETEAWSQWTKTAMAEDNDENWREVTDDGIRFEGLKPGDYTVLFRDANDKQNAKVIAQRELTVGDEAIAMEAESTEEHNGGRDATVTVTAQNSHLDAGTYQFLIRPVEDEESELLPVDKLTDPLDPEKYPEADGWTTPVWQTSDLASGTLSTGVFSGLRSGWYQVAVRTMEGVSATEMQTLTSAYQALLAAQKRVEAAEAALTDSSLSGAADKKAQEIREALQAWQTAANDSGKEETWNNYLELIDNDKKIQTLLTAWADADYADGAAKDAYDAAVAELTLEQAKEKAQAEKDAADAALPLAEKAYTDEKAKLEETAAKAYADDPTLWENAATMLVEVGAENTYVSNKVELYNLRYDRENSLVRVPFTGSKINLSDGAAKQLIKDNAEMDILAYSNKMEVWIPAGTLSEGDKLEDMLMPSVQLPQESGYVVQYTDTDGNTHPVAWSYVTPGKVYYVASDAGKYEIVPENVAFPDVTDDFWGLDAIKFVAARELFEGDDMGRFQPEAPMTRGMFVTVLCRLAGAELDYDGTSDFTDVSPDAWYAPYVAWATENGIVTGDGAGHFNPEEPVSREQMCVLVKRLLDALGVELPEGSTEAFADADAISDWAEDAVGSFTQWGLIQGVGENSFAPSNGASRAEVATLYMRLIQRLLAG